MAELFNNVYTPGLVEPIENRDSIDFLKDVRTQLRETMKEKYEPNKLKTQTEFNAVCLMQLSNVLVGDGDAQQNIVRIKARIPEMHTLLPIPTSETDYNTISLYPTFTGLANSFNPEVQGGSVIPGSRIVVKFDQMDNMVEGKIVRLTDIRAGDGSAEDERRRRRKALGTTFPDVPNQNKNILPFKGFKNKSIEEVSQLAINVTKAIVEKTVTENGTRGVFSNKKFKNMFRRKPKKTTGPAGHGDAKKEDDKNADKSPYKWPGPGSKSAWRRGQMRKYGWYSKCLSFAWTVYRSMQRGSVKFLDGGITKKKVYTKDGKLFGWGSTVADLPLLGILPGMVVYVDACYDNTIEMVDKMEKAGKDKPEVFHKTPVRKSSRKAKIGVDGSQNGKHATLKRHKVTDPPKHTKAVIYPEENTGQHWFICVGYNKFADYQGIWTGRQMDARMQATLRRYCRPTRKSCLEQYGLPMKYMAIKFGADAPMAWEEFPRARQTYRVSAVYAPPFALSKPMPDEEVKAQQKQKEAEELKMAKKNFETAEKKLNAAKKNLEKEKNLPDEAKAKEKLEKAKKKFEAAKKKFDDLKAAAEKKAKETKK